MSSESYQGLARISVYQMTGDDVPVRPISSDYQDLDIENIKALINDPLFLYDEGAGLVKNWTMNPSGPRGKYIIDEDPDNRCYVNHTDYIKVKFLDGPVSISAIIFVYCNQVSQVGHNVILNGRRYPFNLHLLAGGGIAKEDGSIGVGYSQYIPDKQYSIHQFATSKIQEFVDPYNIVELPERDNKDMYQAVICSAELPEKPFMIHNASELLFKMTGDIEATPFDIHRIFVFGANSVTCRPPNNLFPIVQPHNTNLLLSPPGLYPPGPGGPNSCLDIVRTQDQENAMTYVYGPFTTLPEHYQYLANNHSGDIFTKANITAFYYDDGDVHNINYKVPDLNVLIPEETTTFFIEIDPCDIYQFNFEHSGSAVTPTSNLQLEIKFSNPTQEYTFLVNSADHETLATVHTRSRGVVSKWFPGFPWDNNYKTCIMKDCTLIELTVTGVASDATQSVIWHSLLIRTLNPSFICNVLEDETIPPISSKPNQNLNSIIIADTGASDPVWNESKGIYTHGHVVTPAWNINEYPYYDLRHEEYNILDKSFQQYFLSTTSGSSDLTRITDGYFHVDDPFVGDTTIKFSTPVDIFHLRVFFKGGDITTTNALSIGIVDSSGVSSPIRPVQTDFLLVSSANTSGTSVNLRTNPWNFPFTEALFGNVSELIILNPNVIIGFFLWGAYIKDSI